MPKVEDLGDQVSSIAALLYEFLRPNWADGPFDATTKSVAARATLPCRIAATAARWPTRRCARPSPSRSTRTRSTRGSSAAPSRSPTRSISPGAWFYADQPPATFDPAKAKEILEAAGWVDSDGDGIREKDGLKAIIELCTTTRPAPHRHHRPDRWLAGGRRHRGASRTRSPRPTSSPTTTRRPPTPRARLSHRTSTSPSTRSRRSIDPLGGYFSYHSSQFEPDGANDAQVNDPASTRPRHRPDSVDFAAIKDAMAEFQTVYDEQTVEIPLYYRKNIELHRPTRQLLRERDAGRSDVECGRLVQHRQLADPSGV